MTAPVQNGRTARPGPFGPNIIPTAGSEFPTESVNPGEPPSNWAGTSQRPSPSISGGLPPSTQGRG